MPTASVPVFGRSLRYVVVVMGKKPLEEEHHQEAAQSPPHGLVHRVALMKGMGNKMEQCHPEHQPRNKADPCLQSCMSEPQRQQ
jgi:hypothetical protein